MRDPQDYDHEEGILGYNYSPNEMAELSSRDPEKYRRIVSHNTGLSVDEYHRRNLAVANAHLSGKSVTFDGDHAYTNDRQLY